MLFFDAAAGSGFKRRLRAWLDRSPQPPPSSRMGEQQGRLDEIRLDVPLDGAVGGELVEAG